MIRTELIFRHGKREERYRPTTNQIEKIFQVLDDFSSDAIGCNCSLFELEKIIQDYFNINKIIKTKARNHDLVYIRQIFSYFAYLYCGTSLQEIGVFLGGRDHTTIVYARKKIRQGLEIKNEKLINDLTCIKNIISQKNINKYSLHPTLNSLELLQQKGLV